MKFMEDYDVWCFCVFADKPTIVTQSLQVEKRVLINTEVSIMCEVKDGNPPGKFTCVKYFPPPHPYMLLRFHLGLNNLFFPSVKPRPLGVAKFILTILLRNTKPKL